MREMTESLAAAETLLSAARRGLAERTTDRQGEHFDGRQFLLHGYAWMATYVSALRQMLLWASSLNSQGRLTELEELLALGGYGEYLSQLSGGLWMSQGEIVRPDALGVTTEEIACFRDRTASLSALGTSTALRLRIAELIADGFSSGNFGDSGLDDTHAMIRDSFRRLVDEEVEPFAHGWHLRNELIPVELIDRMAQMGLFGLTIPELHGGSGMGKVAMAVVSEELSRGYIGVGSLGTRSEIAAELIQHGGTAEQRDYYLPKLASGKILPAAVFTEPNSGSDLGSIQTRAVRSGGSYKITGAKTWITHASRANLMTLLARTGDKSSGYKGLSMFLAEKPPGGADDPFPAVGMTGSEIHVLGYRGMKEYELAFDEFHVPVASLLGGTEGQGFKQLMTTFESARVQTAARAVGVAQNALELGVRYALERSQFGRQLIQFPRIGVRLALMSIETMMARQLTYFAARAKDDGLRCDVEAGMAKLLGARVAWTNADNSLQIHGGNGYAIEYPISRVLCDARILNIFEGAAEIQAEIVAKRLLSDTN